MKEINIIKPLELTPEQKEELIELCNKTWSDLSWHFWETDDEILDTLGHNNSSILGSGKYYPALEIHWFEFVVRMAIDEELQEFEDFYNKVRP